MDPLSILCRISSKVLDRSASLGLRASGETGGMGSSPAMGTDRLDDLIQSSILEELGVLAAGWGVVSEDGRIEKGDGYAVLFIDPLDGSFNAMNGIPIFSTSMALFDEAAHEVTHAMVVDLTSGRVFHGTRGAGSYLDKERLRTRDRPLDAAAFSVYLGKESVEDVADLLKDVGRCRYLGCDSLEMCLVAQGFMDGTLHMGRVPRKTDIAASMLILREAGGEVFLVRKDGAIAPCRFAKPWDGALGVISLGNPVNIQRLVKGGRFKAKSINGGSPECE